MIAHKNATLMPMAVYSIVEGVGGWERSMASRWFQVRSRSPYHVRGFVQTSDLGCSVLLLGRADLKALFGFPFH